MKRVEIHPNNYRYYEDKHQNKWNKQNYSGGK